MVIETSLTITGLLVAGSTPTTRGGAAHSATSLRRLSTNIRRLLSCCRLYKTYVLLATPPWKTPRVFQ